VHLSKHILDYRKKQTGALRISENVTFTNDDVIGALQQKLPRAPLPFNPALVASRRVAQRDRWRVRLFRFWQNS